MMNHWFQMQGLNMAALLSEDVGAPELRNPKHSAIRFNGWFARLFRGARR